MHSRFGVAVLIATVVATFGAFFLSGHLKSAPAVLQVLHPPTKFISPKSVEPRRRLSNFSFRVKQDDRVTVGIVNSRGDEVKRIITGLATKRFAPVRLQWDGSGRNGAAPDGRYHVRVTLARQGRIATITSPIILKQRPPKPTVVKVRPDVVDPDGDQLSIRLDGISKNRPTDVEIFRTDSDPPRRVARFNVPIGRTFIRWKGLPRARLAPGTYLVRAKVIDRAGNLGASASIPPAAEDIRGNAGFTVRTLAIQAPIHPVAAGTNAEFYIDSRKRNFSWSLRRLGDKHRLRRAKARAGRLAVNVPRTKSGLYLLEARSGHHRASAPLLVQSAQRQRFLVVVPTITWLGLDRVDDTPRDGVVNTLGGPGAVSFPRPIVGKDHHGIPRGFSQTRAMLIFLDRERVGYDIASDISLSEHRVKLSDYAGVLLAGTFRWIPAHLGTALCDFVRGGGRVATFGTDSLRRSVKLENGKLSMATEPSPIDPFGIRIDVHEAERIRLIARKDDPGLGLLTGFSGVLETHGSIEEGALPVGSKSHHPLVEMARNLPEQAQATLASEANPAVAAIRIGKGIVFRVGIGDWADRLAERGVSQITLNIFDLLRHIRPQPRSKR